ncbi:xylan 1,4-beta-xylosidase-like [Haliotis rubra]|uniref:xylan 1,4-beta-xylosidase-like n=1 Tax=Haliotis rubra TaxID=36100 RepID=UPI001EE5B4C6|nr:xylan 1,4-beta-xylosidase-like [Haliotis rubra]
MNPYSTLDKDEVVLSLEHRELALRAAINTFVLLKNDKNTLPLKKNFNKIAVVGPMSNDSQDLFGDYTAFPDPRFVVTPYMGLKRLASTVSLASGCNDTWCQKYDAQAVTAAIYGADVVFVCLGHGTSVESEGKDRTTILLPGSQLQLLKDVVANTSKPVVLLLFNGGPVEISWAVDNPGVSAILECYLPGQTAGDAVYISLTNNGSFSAPGGRLSYTWPASDEQIPAMTNYSMAERTYWYFTQEPLFPFGYGLSYTTFKYSNFSFDKEVNAGDDLSGRLIVNNTGNYDGDEVIQVYISWQNASMTVPQVKLVQFLRVGVQQGWYIGFGFSIAARDMAVWQDDVGWVIKQGVMNIYVGGQQPNQTRTVSSNVEHGQFTIVGEKILGRF